VLVGGSGEQGGVGERREFVRGAEGIEVEGGGGGGGQR
jgi:hypothetical protein